MTTDTPPAFPPMPGSELVIKNAGTAPAYWMNDDLWIVLAEGKDTDGRFSMMEQLLPKGSGPGPHRHTWSDETFYMLDGEMTRRLSPFLSDHGLLVYSNLSFVAVRFGPVFTGAKWAFAIIPLPIAAFGVASMVVYV
jgi:hypothetical protein